jgi:hypothetical protein
MSWVCRKQLGASETLGRLAKWGIGISLIEVFRIVASPWLQFSKSNGVPTSCDSLYAHPLIVTYDNIPQSAAASQSGFTTLAICASTEC